ncbi:unnamed protein product [Acanthoscelides obtectus]|uniref:Uncharacterized protein n=1 Tax=Acanthoscelides obtectus TaxID=200917 RepID=A0A9P0K890_ACAOB|nr:unnamed protein product [Acanthoscelides obtectus]CAK1640396.1 hypothetical protein AOBTE_LOCUS11698 [Acanthoscelides obtectus]
MNTPLIDCERTAPKIGKQDKNPAMADDSGNSTIQKLTSIIEKQAHQLEQQAKQIADQADIIKSLNHSIDCLTAQAIVLYTQLSSDSLKRGPESQDSNDDDALSDDSVECYGFTPARQRKRRTTNANVQRKTDQAKISKDLMKRAVSGVINGTSIRKAAEDNKTDRTTLSRRKFKN